MRFEILTAMIMHILGAVMPSSFELTCCLHIQDRKLLYDVILNYCRVSMAYHFQTGNNEIKLLMEYESVTQKVLLLIESTF
jgi:hypothetical protein